MRDAGASCKSTLHFKKLTEQEKREIGVYIISLYEPFAVLREVFAPHLIALSLVLSFLRERKHIKTASEASLKGYSHTVWREAHIYSATPNVIYFRFCENVKYASRMKYSALPNVKYFHFLRKMKMCGLEIKYRGQP